PVPLTVPTPLKVAFAPEIIRDSDSCEELLKWKSPSLNWKLVFPSTSFMLFFPFLYFALNPMLAFPVIFSFSPVIASTGESIQPPPVTNPPSGSYTERYPVESEHPPPAVVFTRYRSAGSLSEDTLKVAVPSAPVVAVSECILTSCPLYSSNVTNTPPIAIN